MTRPRGAVAATRLRLAGRKKTIAKLRLEPGAEARADAVMTEIAAVAVMTESGTGARVVMAETVSGTGARAVMMETGAEGVRPADAEVLPDAGRGVLQ